jgi:hypothetical protein
LAALRRLQEDGTRVLGTVLNSWNPKKSSVYGPGASSYTHYVRTARLGPYQASN